jgi:putative membrane protein
MKEYELEKKDASLQETLAIDRTRMANDRTLLSFIRTSLYFTVAGLSINSFIDVPSGALIGTVFLVLAFIILVAGVMKYFQQRKKLHHTQRYLRMHHLEWDDDDE